MTKFTRYGLRYVNITKSDTQTIVYRRKCTRSERQQWLIDKGCIIGFALIVILAGLMTKFELGV